MSNRRDYRDYQRDGRPFQPAAENNEYYRQPQMPVGKSQSGKKNAYMHWLHTEGRTRFFNTYGMRYDPKNASDVAKMSEFYKNIPPEQKAAMKAWEKEQNSNPQVYLARRRQLKYVRRHLQHSDIARHREMELAHAENLRKQREVRTESVPINSEIRHIHVYDDLEAYTRTTSDKAKVILKSVLLTKTENNERPLWQPNLTMQFVSMSPLIYSFKMHMNRVSVYPAEVSITTFHPKTGLQETETHFIVYDSEWYQGEEPEDEETAENRKKYAELIGIPETGMPHESAFTPDEALAWLRGKFDSCPAGRILCDKNAYNFVFYGLKTLATYMGHNAVNYFKSRIMGQLVAIQDFTETLLELAPLLIPKEERWGKEAIKQAFEYYNLIPCSDQNRICSTHAAMDSMCKFNCTGAHSARMLQNFFYILRQNKVADIYDYCDGPTHRPCQITEPNGLREALFIARTITRAEEEHFKEIVRREREAYEYQQPYVQGAASAEPIQYAGSETDEYSDDENFEDYGEPAGNYPTAQAPGQPWNPHQNVGSSSSTFATNDNFFSSSRFDPEQLTQRAGVRDMANAHSDPIPVEPVNVAPFAEPVVTAPADLKYLPYGIMPDAKYFVTPKIELILSAEESEIYLQKVPAMKARTYKPIVLTALQK